MRPSISTMTIGVEVPERFRIPFEINIHNQNGETHIMVMDITRGVIEMVCTVDKNYAMDTIKDLNDRFNVTCVKTIT